MNNIQINAVYNNFCYDNDSRRISDWMNFNILGFYKILKLITNKPDPFVEKMSIDDKINYKYNFKLCFYIWTFWCASIRCKRCCCCNSCS